jgi:hypothetical protein
MQSRCSATKADEKRAARRGRWPLHDDVATGRAAPTSLAALVGHAAAHPQSLGPAEVQHLHRAVGNRSLHALLQPSLPVGPSGDVYEREADRVAVDVVRRLRAPAPPQPTTNASDGSRHAVVGRAGRPLDAGLRSSMGATMGADFGGVRVHTGPGPDRLTGALRATAVTVGQDVYFHGSAYDPRSRRGQELIAHELTHVVQQNGSRVRRPQQTGGDRTSGAPAVSSAPQGRAQRKFGFEIELPVLFTREQPVTVASLVGGPDIALTDVPVDAGADGRETHLVDSDECYINVDHSQTLDPLFTAHLAKYGDDNNLTTNAKNSLKAARGELMPNHASIVEVVTNPWDESTLSRTQALNKVRGVIRDVSEMYDAIAGDRKAQVGDYYFGSDAPNSGVFQPRIGYFHATYGVKLSQIPHLFEQTTQQRKRLAEYAKEDPGEKAHAKNVELTSRAVTAARSALKEIKKVWPQVAVTRKLRPNTTRAALSKPAEQEFLGFLTLLCNYFLLMKSSTSGGTLAKQLVGMHYYKSDLYDVATSLPAEVIGPLEDADRTLVEHVIDQICAAVGTDSSDRFNDALAGKTARAYLYQIFRGHFGVIKTDDSGKQYHDYVLAGSINPWSSKLGPEQLGPVGNRALGVVVENRHLEYLDPNYGAAAREWNARFKSELAQYGPPKGDDNRSDLQKAMFESIGARESGPARKPIAQWESLMMGIYDMVKAANARA